MNERVTRLRQRSLDTVAYISAERAELMTEFYCSTRNSSVPAQRALAFNYILKHKEICINEGELIVGERGPAPKATYTYPELCCHSLEDLDILHSRPKISFKVSSEVRSAYEEKIIPYWQGNSMRDIIFAGMSEQWKTAYDAGIFTEFMEQRAPGHTVLDDKIYRLGLLDFIAEIDAHLAKLDYLNDVEAYYKQEELKAMRISAEGIIRFAERYTEKAACFKN